MMRNPRVLIAAAVLAVLAAAAAVLLSARGSEDGSDSAVRTDDPAPKAPLRTVRSELTLERFRLMTTGMPEELLVSLPEQRLNVLKTTGGETVVLLRCANESGGETLRQMVAWPLLEETGYPPHIHQPIRPDVLRGVRACRLTGPGIDFEGRVPGRVPSAE